MIAIAASDTRKKVDLFLQAGAVRGGTSIVAKRISLAMIRRWEVGGFAMCVMLQPSTRIQKSQLLLVKQPSSICSRWGKPQRHTFWRPLK